MIVGWWKRQTILRSPDEGGGGVGNDADAQGDGADGAGSPDGGGNDDAGDGQHAEPTYEELTAQVQEIAEKAEALRVSKLSPEEKAAEEKAKADAEEAAKSSKAPDEYADFKMPKDMPVDEALLNDFKPLAKEMDLSQEKAQKLIDLYAENVAPLMVQRQTEAWNGQLEAWKAECQADQEIGGDRFEPAVLEAKRVINTLGTQELKKVFDDYGLGNNPELVRVFSRMAKYLKEDTVIDGNPAGQAKPKTVEAMAERFYKE